MGFLEKLGEALRTQDNRATAYPLFIVQEKVRILGIDKIYDPDVIWQWKEDAEYQWDTRAEALKALLEQPGDQISNKTPTEAEFDDYIETIGYVDRWDFVCAHLTETAADRYIKQNRHNLKDPRIYVSSQYRCHEFNELIDLVKATGGENVRASV